MDSGYILAAVPQNLLMMGMGSEGKGATSEQF